MSDTTVTNRNVTSIDELVRDSYKKISLYSPNRTPAEVDLSDNTNCWGVPPNTTRLIREMDLTPFTRYPNIYSKGVKETVAEYLTDADNKVGIENVVTGCGSDDVLDSIFRAFGVAGDKVVYPVPSFPMIPLFATMNGLESVGVQLTDSFDLDVDAILAEKAKIVYICSPNNPTGTPVSRAAVERVVKESGAIVMIDEAYAEYAGESFLDIALANENVVIIRTFSKAFGLAGLRIGYAVGGTTAVAEIEKSRGPYKVNALGERAAIWSMTEDMDWVNEKVAEAIANRDRLIEELRGMGLSPIPSVTNFVMVPVAKPMEVEAEMRKLGVAIRPFANLPIVGDTIRISVGPWDMMEKALKALKAVIG